MTEEGIITVSYPRGQLRIILSEFFPTSGKRIRQLFRAVDMDWENRARISEDILRHLEQAHAELRTEEMLKLRADNHVSAMTDAKEMEEPVRRQAERVEKMQAEIKVLPKAVRPPYLEQLKKEKEILKGLKARRQYALSDAAWQKTEFTRVQARDKKYRENISLVRELSAGYTDL